MAFTIQSFLRVSSSGNARTLIGALGQYLGAPDIFTYISSTDTLAQIEAPGYFNELGRGEVDVYDKILVTDSTGARRDYYFSVVNTLPIDVQIARETSAGDVTGPASSTNEALAIYNGTTGKIIKNSSVTITDITNLQTSGNTLSVTQSAHGFVVGDVVYINGSGVYVKAQANADATSEVVGIVSAVTDVNTFTLQFGGLVTGLSGLTVGAAYYLSPSSAGAITATKPTTVGQVVKPLLVARTTTSAFWVNYLGALL